MYKRQVVDDTHGLYRVRYAVNAAVVILEDSQVAVVYLIFNPGIVALQIVSCHVLDVLADINSVHQGNGGSLTTCVQSHPFLFLTAVVSGVVYGDVRICFHEICTEFLEVFIMAQMCIRDRR